MLVGNLHGSQDPIVHIVSKGDRLDKIVLILSTYLLVGQGHYIVPIMSKLNMLITTTH